MASTTAVASVRATYPLDPLTAEEITGAWEILRSQRTLGPRTRVVSIALQEPPKETVLVGEPGDEGVETLVVRLLLAHDTDH
jgi:Cu2+-containing amine oxidase